MVGILIIAHGSLGDSLIHCASHVMGKRPLLLRDIAISTQDDPQLVLPLAEQMVGELDQGNGVLVLSDIYGATPCNIASKLIVPGKVEGLAGVNLPMLVRALTYRSNPLPMVLMKAQSGGTEGILAIKGHNEHAAA